MFANEEKVIAVLTLERHKDGVWIRKLVKELVICLPLSSEKEPEYTVDVVSIESLHLKGCPLSSPPPKWAGLVNRVSDAADPAQMKLCLAVLQLAELWGIPVFNGPRSYSICCNKTLHHHVFARAGLKTPRSVQVQHRSDTTDTCSSTSSTVENIHNVTCNASLSDNRDNLRSAAQLLEEMGSQYPLLMKPNSGGFGAGITLFSNEVELQSFSENITCNNTSCKDGISLLQEYIRPADSCIYRVWFLQGRVQGAVRRVLVNSDDKQPNEFGAGCTGDTCSLPLKKRKDMLIREVTMYSWDTPPDVKDDIYKILNVVGDDCNAGSVEFLVDSGGKRVYFDLNLLSTLPLLDNRSVDDTEGNWLCDYNPWSELARAIIQTVVK